MIHWFDTLTLARTRLFRSTWTLAFSTNLATSGTEPDSGLPGFVTPTAPAITNVHAGTSGARISDRGMFTHNQPREQTAPYAQAYCSQPARPQPARVHGPSWIPPATPQQLIQSPPPGLHPARHSGHGPIPNHRSVVIHAPHQQTGRYCEFHGGKGRAGASAKDMKVRDFMMSFQIVGDAQVGTWMQEKMIAECKNPCNHKLDKQLANVTGSV